MTNDSAQLNELQKMLLDDKAEWAESLDAIVEQLKKQSTPVSASDKKQVKTVASIAGNTCSARICEKGGRS